MDIGMPVRELLIEVLELLAAGDDDWLVEEERCDESDHP